MSAPEIKGHLPAFSWVLDGELAGMAHPGVDGSSLRAVFEALKDVGVRAIVSLTEHALDEKPAKEHGISCHHAPVRDFCAPAPGVVDEVCGFIDSFRDADQATVVHCGAGMGRTGTILACYLVHIGANASEAVARIRALRPGSIETAAQEVLIQVYADRRPGRAAAG